MSYSASLDDLTARGAKQTALHERAAVVAARLFGRKVFVGAVIEVSNFCRENCRYCGIRRENRAFARVPAQHDELAELLVHHRPPAVTDVNIQAGEDPVAAREIVQPLVRTLRRETKLGIGVCLGTLDYVLYEELHVAGASVYIMKFETADARRYDQVRAPGSLAERLDHIRWLPAHGWKVSSRFIAVLPEQDESELLDNIRLASELPLPGSSVSPPVPGNDTPLSAAAPGDVETALNCMALFRLARPDWVIPAVSALNLVQPGNGYRGGCGPARTW